MIRPLRQRHRVTVLALGVIVPVTFAFGVMTRHEVPTNPSGNDSHLPASGWTALWSRDDLWGKQMITTRVLTNAELPGTQAIELYAKHPIVQPDLLVYWAPQTNTMSDSLPDNAFLLGSFTQSFPSPLSLPAQAIVQPGVLILYSLADQEIVAVSNPFAGK